MTQSASTCRVRPPESGANRWSVESPARVCRRVTRLPATALRFLPLLLAASSGWPATRLAAAPADNVVIVVDASGSMGHRMTGSRRTKMEEAKDALLRVVQSIPPETQLGMLVFSSKNLTQDLVYPLGPVDREKLAKAIRSPVPGGGTPLGAYLKKGADLLLQQRETQHGYGTFRLLVVTDGEATDADLMERHLPEILARGVTVDVIGVDMKTDHALATRVHSYRRANDPQALVQGLTEVLAEVGGVQDDAVSAEAQANLQALPDELGQAMLQALVNSSAGNHPIGERPPQAPADALAVAQGEPPGLAPSVHVEGPVSRAPPLPGSAPPTPAKSFRSWLSLLCIFFFGALGAVAFVLALAAFAIYKSNQRGR